MVGRDIQDIYDYRPRERGAVALKVDGLLGPGLREPVSFDVHKGEILGLFGLVGAGRTELFRLLSGLERNSAGRLELCGRELKLRSPRDAIAAGDAAVSRRPQEGGHHAAVQRCRKHQHQRPRRAFHLRLAAARWWEKGNADKQIKAMKVKTPNAEQKIMYLSGGNQQKAILGRWLSMPMKVLLLDEPTRGIDIGAKAEIYQIIHNLAASGIAVIVVSSDLMEVMGISDRILVLCEGALRGELTREQANESNLLQLALPRQRADGVAN